MVLAHEKQLIPHYEEIKLEFKEALEDHNAAHVPSTMAHEFSDRDLSSGRRDAANHHEKDVKARKLEDEREAAVKGNRAGEGGSPHHNQRLTRSVYDFGQKSSGTGAGASLIDSENVFIDDSMVNKYKENDRELKRELKHMQTLRDAENRFRNKMADWLDRE